MCFYFGSSHLGWWGSIHQNQNPNCLHKFMIQKRMGSTIILTCHKRIYQPTSSIDFGLVVTSCWRFRVFALREKNMNRSSMILVLRKRSFASLNLKHSQYSFIPLRCDHSPCTEKTPFFKWRPAQRAVRTRTMRHSRCQIQRLLGCAKTVPIHTRF